VSAVAFAMFGILTNNTVMIVECP